MNMFLNLFSIPTTITISNKFWRNLMSRTGYLLFFYNMQFEIEQETDIFSNYCFYFLASFIIPIDNIKLSFTISITPGLIYYVNFLKKNFIAGITIIITFEIRIWIRWRLHSCLFFLVQYEKNSDHKIRNKMYLIRIIGKFILFDRSNYSQYFSN